MEQNKKSLYLSLFGIILAVGLMASAFILGNQFKNLRQPGVITVKGLAEANYSSSLATWSLTIKGWGASYAEALTDNQKQLNQTVRFLNSKQFDQTERYITDITVSPYMETYKDERGETQSRQNGYVSTREVNITTKDLNKLQLAIRDIQKLLAENSYITSRSPEYYLENLDTIKRDLISSATKDGYLRAEEFAKTSNVKVGTLKSASQGSFNIYSAQPGTDDGDDYGGTYNTSSIEKRVRLVVTLSYSID